MISALEVTLTPTPISLFLGFLEMSLLFSTLATDFDANLQTELENNKDISRNPRKKEMGWGLWLLPEQISSCCINNCQ